MILKGGAKNIIRCMITLHIDMRSTASPGIEINVWVTRVLTKEVPGGKDACCKVLMN